MADDQTKLLTEIRDITREHLELYRKTSTKAINAQKRAIQIWLGVIIILVLAATYLVVQIVGWVEGQSPEPPHIYVAPQAPNTYVRPVYEPQPPAPPSGYSVPKTQTDAPLAIPKKTSD
ncbi:MAG TPA: hypothetical protein VGJ26_14390 [Pirellulales bacterium]|jgi:hypothetical protein